MLPMNGQGEGRKQRAAALALRHPLTAYECEELLIACGDDEAMAESTITLAGAYNRPWSVVVGAISLADHLR